MWWMLAALATTPGMDEVATAAGMELVVVESMLTGIEKDPSILERMARPYEAKPWHAYRKLFLTPERIAAGKAFAAKHQAVLARAEQQSGVPASVIVAILGVETAYGKTMGGDPVVQALYTLGFHHPSRGSFFRKELGHFLRLATDQGWGLTATQGSYAGAMGMGQFMPSSYRNYAVDFDGDGAIDLFHSTGDAIGSVGNYLGEHGWRAGDRVLGPTGAEVPAGSTVYRFELEAGEEELVGYPNFAVILTYNRSPLYARAVWELAEAIRTTSAGEGVQKVAEPREQGADREGAHGTDGRPEQR